MSYPNNLEIDHWSEQDFVAYLYICIAFSDFEYVKAEKDTIVAKLGKKDQNDPESYQKMITEYSVQSTEEVKDFISYICKRKKWGKDLKKRVVADLNEIMEADGIIRDLELDMYDTICQELEA